MCGIAGYLTPAEPATTRAVDAMLDQLVHRGPDDRETWAGSHLALGHTRLSILDPTPRGRQPFVTEDGGGVLTYNGEVYNFRELRRELEREGVHFRSHSDSEVVLHALHRWGPEHAVPRLNGMFAFAYHDRRDGSLWLARDRMGIKPLYVARSNGILAFASEMKALFAHSGVARTLDEHALVNLLLYERFEGTMTPYRGVQALAPGTLCRVSPGLHTCTSKYFDLLRDLDPERLIRSETEAFSTFASAFEQLLRSSVRAHLASDVPVATMCSGGLDSGLVTMFAREVDPGITAYVADVEGMNGEEARRARLVCDAINVQLRVVPVSVDDYLRALPAALHENDQPLFFSQGPVVKLVAQAIHRDGFKVVLTGDGADELFGGYDNHAAAHRLWRRRRRHAAWIRNNRFTRLLGRLDPRFRPLDLEALAGDPLQPDRGRSGRVPGLNVLLVDGARRRLREARLFRRLGGLSRLEDRAFLTSSFEDVYVHLREYLRTSDGMSMQRSVENRVPFLDNGLVDFGLHLPVFAKFHRGTSKRIVRHVAKRYLPDQVIRAPKIGFGMRPALFHGLLPLLRDGMLAEVLKWCREDQDDILAMVPRHTFYQFRLIGTELWLRTTFAGESPEDLSRTLLRLKGT